MSDLNLRVTSIKDLVFNPNRLKINITSQNILSNTSIIQYSLYEEVINNSKYISRNWVDEGTIELPTNILLQSVNTETQELNEYVFDMLLSQFNLSLGSISPLSFISNVLEIEVVAAKNFIFTPNELKIRTISSDILTSETLIYFELKDTTLNNSRYLSRDWIDKGSIFVPTTLLLQAVNTQAKTMNVAVTNYFLESFNLQLTSEHPF